MPSRPKAAPAPPELEEATFEQSLEELDAIIEVLDGGPQGLDELVGKYERGMGLLARCQRQLDAAQLRIEQITRRADGAVELDPLSAEPPVPARSAAPPSDASSDEIRLF